MENNPEVIYEFFAPFVHIEGKYEWCRIRSPTHGIFDCFILLGDDTSVPATVYVADAIGERFMHDRYPECTTWRTQSLRLEESEGGRRVRGRLTADKGPVARVDLAFEASATSTPRNVPYGGEGRPVWGSRFTCWGIDLVLPAVANGRIQWRDGRKENHAATPAWLTLGSFARIEPLATASTRGVPVALR